MKPIVIYHADCLDGFTAAWVIWKHFPDWEFYAGKYGEEPPDVTNRDVYLVDFSYKRPVILSMAEKSLSIVILDHHKTAEADLVDLPGNVSVEFDMSKSGARLTWDYFHDSSIVPPPLLLRVEDRDLWKFQYPDTKALATYLSSVPFDFEEWGRCMYLSEERHDREEMEGYGDTLLRKQAKDITEILRGKFRIVLDGHSIWAANVPPMWSSDAGHTLSEKESFALTFSLDGTHAIVSLRSAEEGADVSEIAKKFGGGGHKHASGFKVSFAEFIQLMDGRI